MRGGRRTMRFRSWWLAVGGGVALSPLVSASTTDDGTSYEIAWLQPVATWGSAGGNKIDYQLAFLPDRVRVKSPGLATVGGCERPGLEIPRNGETRRQSADAATTAILAYTADGSDHRLTLTTTARAADKAERSEVARLHLRLAGSSCTLVSYTRDDTPGPAENLAGAFHYRCVPFALQAFDEGRSCEE